ncbi:hypothetical protein V5799_010475 [Amblyomma americanum]|uniref:SCP domain-containing protein n=1 Tax=Amblyomma americanum TaxID=6943 RepID=A0AAQ4EK52_AMBAM
METVRLLPLSSGKLPFKKCRKPVSSMPSHALCFEGYFSYCYSDKSETRPWTTDILRLHNHYRSQLALGHLADFPATGNMLEMCWDNQLAEVAQALAERCSTPEGIVSHDRQDDRTTLPLLKVGQNLFSQRAPFTTKTVAIKWHFFVRHWFDEKYLCSPSKAEKYEAVKGTKYSTQVAWARSYAVGCGFTYNFVHPNVQESNDPNEGAFRMSIYVATTRRPAT